VTAPPEAGYFGEKLAEGWRLVAIEWERGAATSGPSVEDIPFGLRVASDWPALEENPDEVQVLLLMLEVLVQDGPLSTAAPEDQRSRLPHPRQRAVDANGPVLSCCPG